MSVRAAQRPRRRSKRGLGVRLRRFWILGVVVAIALVWGGLTLATLPAFHVHELSVTGDARVTRSEIVARAAIGPNENIWLLDRDAAEKRIEAIPYVSTARIHRRPVGRIWIEVTERHADACVRDAAGHEMLVDDSLRILESVCTAAAAVTFDIRDTVDAAPGAFVRDPEALALQTDARALAAAGQRYRSFAHDAFGELEATMPTGIRVRFGDDDDLDRKERLVGPILAELGPRVGNVRSVDLRAPSTPVVEYRK